MWADVDSSISFHSNATVSNLCNPTGISGVSPAGQTLKPLSH